MEKVTYSGARPVRVRVYIAMHVSQMRAWLGLGLGLGLEFRIGLATGLG